MLTLNRCVMILRLADFLFCCNGAEPERKVHGKDLRYPRNGLATKDPTSIP